MIKKTMKRIIWNLIMAMTNFKGAYAVADDEIINSINNLLIGDLDNSRESFIDGMYQWIMDSKLNTVTGLNNYKYTNVINGTSESFQMFFQRHHEKSFKFFVGDFTMHKITSNHMDVPWNWITDPSQINEGDAVIISNPFSDFGDTHPMYNDTMDRCTALNVPVLVDCAYFGMCYDMDIDLNHDCIEEAVFSLSKTFPIINARSGVSFRKIYIDDSIEFANQQGIINLFGVGLGNYCISNWSADHIPNKYKYKQQEICKELNITPTNCVIFGLGNDKEYNRGNDTTRLCISNELKYY